jgi:phage antirepressor YoqD-like protein
MQGVMIRKAAKQLDIGSNTLFKKLRKAGVLKSNNLPRRDMIERGLMMTEIRSYRQRGTTDAVSRPYEVTLVTEEGVEFLKHFLDHSEHTNSLNEAALTDVSANSL